MAGQEAIGLLPMKKRQSQSKKTVKRVARIRAGMAKPQTDLLAELQDAGEHAPSWALQWAVIILRLSVV
jgi:hypothetical protein